MVKGGDLRAFKISKEQFQEVFLHRDLLFRERHLESIWFLELNKYRYVILQRANFLGVLFALIACVILTTPTLASSGLVGVKGLWCESLRRMMGEPTRLDDCPISDELTGRLIKLAGWSP